MSDGTWYSRLSRPRTCLSRGRTDLDSELSASLRWGLRVQGGLGRVLAKGSVDTFELSGAWQRFPGTVCCRAVMGAPLALYEDLLVD